MYFCRLIAFHSYRRVPPFAVSELPEHLLVSFREKCAQKSEELLSPNVPADDRRAVDSDEVLNILFTARRAMRRQQQAMLKDRFVRADADGNGVLSLAEFWVALQVTRLPLR